MWKTLELRKFFVQLGLADTIEAKKMIIGYMITVVVT